ncbi:MAG: cytochrome-c oxidase, cbb3-type subunit II [Planctomycetota bacterium]|nr:cytochrome-c oxidase, cbb3-type subunit II [Planctomycetota bacterium]
MTAVPAAEADPTSRRRFACDDRLVGRFMLAAILWGLLGLLAGLYLALELVVPALNLDLPAITFGRLRPVHTNVLIFGFAGNAFFAAVYYSIQRLLEARLFSGRLGGLHFWLWQLVIVAAAVTLPLGFTQGREYGELAWPLDVALAVAWLLFAVNVFATIARRRVKRLYVALWFYLAAIIVFFLLYIVASLALPFGALRSYPLYSGAGEAAVQWWYGFGMVIFLLTFPFLGMMYYFLPKAAGRPLFSYRLAIVHFWSLVILALWGGAHHLLHTAAPAWLGAIGMAFSVMLWMPSLAGVVNGLLTVRGAGERIVAEPVLWFLITALVFYGISAFGGPFISIASVNALIHYTDWTIAHVHLGVLGFVGFMIFGVLYWLAPRVFQTDLFSRRMTVMHFWLAAIGALMYVFPIYAAGLLEGLMWRATDEGGNLVHGRWLEVTELVAPLYWVRAAGGAVYILGAVLLLVNLLLTRLRRPASLKEEMREAPAQMEDDVPPPPPEKDLENVVGIARTIDRIARLHWHQLWERRPLRMARAIIIVIALASLIQLLPMLLIDSNAPVIEAVEPYTPLELAGRDIYVAEGCYSCHSQMVRPMRHETERFGSYSRAGEFIYDRPFQWGSRRIGPDLHRIGQRNPSVLWHVTHLRRPTETSEGSIMPAFPWLLEEKIDYEAMQSAVAAMSALGVPYDELSGDAGEIAREQGRAIIERLRDEDETYPAADLEDRKIIALVAYVLRLGTDISNVEPEDDGLLIGALPEGGAR